MCQTFFQIVRIPDRTMPSCQKVTALEQDKVAQAEVVMLSFRKVAGEGTSSASL